jgi:phosphoglycolate phosphatase
MQYVYFDFDGTLANSIVLAVEITNFLAPKLGFNTVDDSKIDYYRTLTGQEILKEFRIPLIKLPIVAPAYKIELNKRLDKLMPYDGIEMMLKQLSEKFKVGILTSNSVENVRKFLVKHNMLQYISDIRSEFHLFGKHNALRKIISKLKIDKKDLIYVGDETRDIESTKKLDIASIAVTWGFNAESLLEKFNPNYFARTANDIVGIVEQHFEK